MINFTWHPHENIFSFVTSEGELFIYPSFLSSENAQLLQKPLQPAPFIHDPLSETSGNARKSLTNGLKRTPNDSARRQGTPTSLDDILGPESAGEEDDFVEDDDGAGYLDEVNGYGKRSYDLLNDFEGPHRKRRATHETWSPRIHQSFQPGSTPWRGNRRYLCKSISQVRGRYFGLHVAGLNLTGFVWTVDQDTHHTVTVEFYDREFHRDFHFTDPYLYDKACLSESTLFRLPKQKAELIRRAWNTVFMPADDRKPCHGLLQTT